MRVGIYVRLSDDRDGTQTATARQQADCRQFAEAREWEVVDVFEDVDLSAYKRSVKRPEFERMIAAVSSGAVDGVLVWKIDRLSRRMRDLVRLDEACESARPKAFIATVVDGIDTRHPTGRFVAELLVAQARMESENTAIRVARKHLERAQAGEPQNGGRPLFGYTADHLTVVTEEATLLREARDRIFAGETIHGVCVDWRSRGILTNQGKEWRQSNLQRTLCNAGLSGQREHRGVLTPGTWPAIFTPEDTTRLRALLLDPSRRSFTTRARKYLLTGLLYCGREGCGEALVGRPNNRVRRYVCNGSPGARGCGRIHIGAQTLEDYISELALRSLGSADVRRYAAAEGEDAVELARAVRADEEALEQLTRDYYVDKRIGRAEFFGARDALQSQLEGRRRTLARSTGAGVLVGLVGAEAEARRLWAERDVEWRRTVLAALLDRVTVNPGRPGYTRFDESRLVMEWRY